MSTLSIIQAQVERRLPGALSPHIRMQHELIETGIAAVDEQTGGIPKGALTELCAPRGLSSGRTTVLLSTMARLTDRGEFCVLIDAGDSFDPSSAVAAGVELRRLLWVRCELKQSMRPLEQVFKAADLVIQNGGFGLIALDLGGIEERFVRKVPLTTWFRFARVIEKLPTALVTIAPFPAAQSCATLTMNFCGTQPWRLGSEIVSHARVFNAVDFTVEATRTKMRKPMQSVRPKFSARTQWA